MKFSAIPQLPRAYYSVHVSWDSLEFHIERYRKEYGLTDSPDYQRAHVWTREQQIAYAEYIFQGGEVGQTITFNCPNWQTMRGKVGPMEVVDGKQRLEAAKAFMTNQIPIFGYYYKDFEPRMNWEQKFIFSICSLNKREDVLRLYLNINAGGTPHTENELDKVRKLLTESLA